MRYSPTEIARQFIFIREAQSQGQNRGLRVEAIQHYSGGQAGDSWCMEFVWLVLDICFQGKSPIGRMQAVQTLYAWAQRNDCLVTDPEPDDLFLYVNDVDHAHHVGIVTSSSPLLGIAGNTSEDGSSSNGDRVAEHAISAKVFVRLPRGE